MQSAASASSPAAAGDSAADAASESPRIALIHATPLAVAPVQQAFARLWPQARCSNLLEDSLSADHARNGGRLDAAMTRRFLDLARYVRSTGAQAILFTCSAFGPAIEAAGREVGIPTLKPNEAMFRQALLADEPADRPIHLIATFAPSLPPMQAEFEALARELGRSRPLQTHLVPDAMDLLARGEAQRHHQLIADCVACLPRDETVLLAQFSMAAAAALAQAGRQAPVLTSPDCAVQALQAVLTQAASR